MAYVYSSLFVLFALVLALPWEIRIAKRLYRPWIAELTAAIRL